MSTAEVTKRGETMSYQVHDGVLELALYRSPCNEIGSLSLEELESFSRALQDLESQLHAVIVHSEMKAGFCAGADLRELYRRSHYTSFIGEEDAWPIPWLRASHF